VDTLSYKTKSANKATVQQDWWVVDAKDQTLGRLASKIASILRGKHKPSYTPHVDCGDCVIVLNADKVVLTGKKMKQKVHRRHTGYPGGQRERTPKEIMDKFPTRLIEMAIKGMLPKNKLGRAMADKLFVYTGTEHPHQAQQPSKLELK